MATIKKISGLSSVTTPGSTDKLLVEDSNGNLKYTTVGGVNNHTHSYAGSASAGGSATSSLSIAAGSKLESATAVDNFLGSGVQFSAFSNYKDIGFGGNDGMMISFPWPGNTAYGSQIAFDDATTGLVKVRGKSTSWGSWKQLWKEGDSITAPSITATNGFTGNLTGDVTGNASTVSLSNGTADASRFIIFQDSNNSTSTLTACYDVDFKYNPISNLMNVGSVQLNSKVTLQYNSSTESLDFVFA